MSDPDWKAYVQWQPPRRVADLIENYSQISRHPGWYAFTEDKGPLRKGHVLYIGETSRADGFYGRFRPYLKANPEETKVRHKGALFLLAHRLENMRARAAQPGLDRYLWVRWAPMVTDKRTLRDIEAAMMQYYNAKYNHRDMGAETPFDTL